MPRHFFIIILPYWLFIIYGSLVPFDYHPVLFADALSRFQQIPNLKLGIESRADWIANILLYIPLAFFCTASVHGIRQPLKRGIASLFVVFFCLATAILVEFAQIFFPPRTVSINDLIAETMGIGIGFFGWHLFGGHFIKYSQQLASNNWLPIRAGIIFYLSIYILLNLFPFDFVASHDEFAQKLASGSVGILFAPDNTQDLLRLVLKFIAETVVIMPLGALISYLPKMRLPLLVAVIAGFLLGVAIESIQLFIFSAFAQGISVMTRMLGMGLGVTLTQWLKKQDLNDWKGYALPLAIAAIPPYILLVMAVNGWFQGTWLPLDTVMAKLYETQFLPFYYFYYTTETVAMASLLSNAAAYFPVGCFFWMGQLASPDSRKTHWMVVGLTATAFALIIETGKLFLAEKHADPTDILIAFTAAASGYAALLRLQQLAQTNRNKNVLLATLAVSQSLNHTIANQPIESNVDSTHHPFALPGFLLLLLTALAVADYPTATIGLGLFLAGYACLLWRYPQSWLLALPALLPVFDFTPYTGRFFFDEFDLLVMVTLAIGYYRLPKQDANSHPKFFKKRIWLLLILFSISYLTSFLLGLLPFAPLDANALNNYYSHYNALRVGKGVFWAFLLLPLLRHNLQSAQALPLFCYGILLGLMATSCFALIERWVFPGLTDFSFDYRINALFSTMHTGGGHFESYLSLAMPFIATLFFKPHRLIIKSIAALFLFAISLYALLMTFSRGGYIALTIGLAVLVIALLASKGKQLFNDWKPYLPVLLLLGLVPTLTIPVFQGDTIKQRFNAAGRDKDIRANHWHDAIDMMDPGMRTALFGMGLGSFPRTYFLLNNESPRPATYLLEKENNNAYLRFRGGDALYFGQYINLKPHTVYQLRLDLRSNGENLPLSIMICEKSVQYSFRCQSATQNTNGFDWQTAQQTIDSGELGAISPDIANGWLTRPVQLTLLNSNGEGRIIDIDNIQLLDNQGKNLIQNGDFSHSTDFWFFSTDKHNPWHIFNLWVDVLFHTGWLGLVSFALIILATLLMLLTHLKGNTFTAVLLSAFSGFIVVGFVDSPFDAPRLTLFFFLLIFMGLAAVQYPKTQQPFNHN